jgi:hypothetical protein
MRIGMTEWTPMKRNRKFNTKSAFRAADDDPTSVRFFDEGDGIHIKVVQEHPVGRHDELLLEMNDARRRRPPVDGARREVMRNYVKATMAVCLGICALAVVGRLFWAAPPEEPVATTHMKTSSAVIAGHDFTQSRVDVCLEHEAPRATPSCKTLAP